MSETYENRYSYTPNIVMITGATGDFGKAFANRFAALGSKIVIVGRNAQKIEDLKAQLEKTHKVDVHSMVFDMADKEPMIEAFGAIPEDFQNIELLINNAGLALGLEPAYKCDLEDWETMVSVNNMSLIRMTRLVIEGMAERKCGHIMNIGSTAGSYPYPGGNVYCASKAFVKQFSLSLRADLQGTNIRVTNIEPGMIETQFSAVRFKGDAAKSQNVYANTKNMGADDVAEAVVWSATLPPYFNVNRLEIMPTVQSFASHPIERFD